MIRPGAFSVLERNTISFGPDLHFLGLFNQIITEIGMSNANELFCSTPDRPAFHTDCPLFGYQVLNYGTRYGYRSTRS